MSDTDRPLEQSLPTVAELRERLCRALREADLVRKLIKVAERRDSFRAADAARQEREEPAREDGGRDRETKRRAATVAGH